MVVRKRMKRANKTVKQMENKAILLEALAEKEAKALDEIAKMAGR